jgi:hypothetical protein
MSVGRIKYALIFILAFGLSGASRPEVWKTFATPAFSVSYPASWVRRPATPKGWLGLKSNRDGATGVPVVRKQGFIGIFEGEGSPRSSLDQIISHYVYDGKIISKRTVTGSEINTLCRPMVEVVFKEPITPQEGMPFLVDNIMYDGFFCDLSDHKVVVLLGYIEGDDKRAGYRRVAVRIAKSLKSARAG